MCGKTTALFIAAILIGGMLAACANPGGAPSTGGSGSPNSPAPAVSVLGAYKAVLRNDTTFFDTIAGKSVDLSQFLS